MMSIDKIPTPETDAEWNSPDVCTQFPELAYAMREKSKDLERRLTIAREELEKCLGWTHRALELEISSSMSAAQCVDIKSAREALDLTAPKQ